MSKNSLRFEGRERDRCVEDGGIELRAAGTVWTFYLGSRAAGPRDVVVLIWGDHSFRFVSFEANLPQER